MEGGSTGAKVVDLIADLHECTHYMSFHMDTHVDLNHAFQQPHWLQESNRASDNGSHSVEVEV